MKDPTKEELLAIAGEALEVPLTDYHKANVEQTAKAIVDGDTTADEKRNLELIKMLLLTSHRVREIKAGG